MSSIILENIGIAGKESGRFDIVIQDGFIRNILPAGTYRSSGTGFSHGAGDYGRAGGDTGIIKCAGKTAVPGFINMHIHAAMTLMRGVGEDIAFHQWIKRIWEVETAVDEEYVYWGTKVAGIEMLRTGTTTFNDHYWYPQASRRAALELGLRPVVSHVLIDHNDKSLSSREKDVCTAEYERSLSWSDSGAFVLGLHSIYSVSEDLMQWASEFRKKHGLKLHIHLSETRKEVDDCIKAHGISPVQYADRFGLLGPDTVAAHTLWLSDDDIDLLGRRGVSCVHNINSNLKLASGYKFRYCELKDAGANVCIGTDGCASSNNLDILEALKTAAMVQKAWRDDPSVMPLPELIDMASANGAAALGLNTGAIEEGKEADILIVDTDNSFFLSPAPFLANFIYSAHSDSIDSVICRGRIVMHSREIDGEKEILSEARTMLEKIVRSR